MATAAATRIRQDRCGLPTTSQAACVQRDATRRCPQVDQPATPWPRLDSRSEMPLMSAGKCPSSKGNPRRAASVTRGNRVLPAAAVTTRRHRSARRCQACRSHSRSQAPLMVLLWRGSIRFASSWSWVELGLCACPRLLLALMARSSGPSDGVYPRPRILVLTPIRQR